MTSLDEKLGEVLRTTTRHLERLSGLKIKTVRDFLQYYPWAYDDRRKVTKVVEMRTDQENTVRGKISNLSSERTFKARKLLVRALFTDDTSSVEVVWFNQPYLLQVLKNGMEVILTGKLKFAYGKMTLSNPIYEPASGTPLHTLRIVPKYHETEGLHSRWIREKMKPLMPLAKQFEDYLPKEIREAEKLIDLGEAVYQIHFPTDDKRLVKAKERLAFDELFLLQFLALQKRWRYRQGIKGFEKRVAVEKAVVKKFIGDLPYELTGAQKRVIKEILADLDQDFPMLRLLQGDVGSGKTVVAAVAALNVIKAGFQVVIMAPTTILANQHFSGLAKLLDKYKVRTRFLAGSTSAAEKKKVYADLKAGKIDLLIGTHALIQEKVEFKRLGLAIVDEQHRFGVKQRDILKAHGSPHILSLSATPIPRTLAMTIYGDQDLSIIDEMPPGRQKIITRLVPEKKRLSAYGWIESEVKKGRQVFVICPLIDESDVLEVKSAKKEFEYLAQAIFPELTVGLIHGKLKPAEKNATMDEFAAGKIDVLVSTSVIEVGIDVPNATIMMIEGAERFGLAQLHQFRGRVGRGEQQSYCFLFTEKAGPDAFKRLKALEGTTDGFELAQLDLDMRGPGEIYGYRQSGIPDLKMASLADSLLIKRARSQAAKLVEGDPELEEFAGLRARLRIVSGS